MSIRYRCARCKGESDWNSLLALPKNWSRVTFSRSKGSYSSQTHYLDFCEGCSAKVEEAFGPVLEPPREERLVSLLQDVMYDVACDAIANRSGS